MAIATKPDPTRAAARPPARASGNHVTQAAVLVLAACAAVTRFYAIDRQSLWYDEGVSAGMLGQGPAAIAQQAAADFHPPLYYLLLAAWARVFGDSTIALRGLSACAGLAVVILTWKIASALLGNKTGWSAAVWALLAPLGIMFSQEIRMYMPVAAAVAAAACCAVVWLDRASTAPLASADQRRLPAPTYLAGYVLTAAVALYLQYVAALGLAAIGLYGLLRVRRRALVYWLGANALALLIFAPWLPTFHHQLSTGHTATTAQTGGAAVLSAAFRSLLVGIDGLPVANGTAVVMLSVLVVLGTAQVLRGGRRQLLPVLMVVVPLLGAGAYAAWRSVYEVRYVLVALPGVAILGGAGVWQAAGLAALSVRPRSAETPVRRTATVAVLALAIAAPLTADLRYYVAPPSAHDDYRGLAQTVARLAQPGDAVLLYPPGQNHVFRYYYRGPDPVVGLPLQRPPDEGDVTARLTALFQAHPRVWVVEYGAGEADPAGVVSSWLGRNAFLASHQWFGSPQLLLYAAAVTAERPVPSNALFDNGVSLQSYVVSPRTVRPGEAVEITLNWQARQAVSKRFTVFTHILDASNHVAAQHDGEPVSGTLPTTTWPLSQTVTDRHGVVIPLSLPAGTYTVEVGMYLPTTTVRADVVNQAGRVVADHLILGSVVVQPGHP